MEPLVNSKRAEFFCSWRNGGCFRLLPGSVLPNDSVDISHHSHSPTTSKAIVSLHCSLCQASEANKLKEDKCKMAGIPFSWTASTHILNLPEGPGIYSLGKGVKVNKCMFEEDGQSKRAELTQIYCNGKLKKESI